MQANIASFLYLATSWSRQLQVCTRSCHINQSINKNSLNLNFTATGVEYNDIFSFMTPAQTSQIKSKSVSI